MVPEGLGAAALWQRLSAPSRGIAETTAALARPNIWRRGGKSQSRARKVVGGFFVVVDGERKQRGAPLPRRWGSRPGSSLEYC